MAETDKPPATTPGDERVVERLGEARDLITAEIGKAIVGMEPVIAWIF